MNLATLSHPTNEEVGRRNELGGASSSSSSSTNNNESSSRRSSSSCHTMTAMILRNKENDLKFLREKLENAHTSFKRQSPEYIDYKSKLEYAEQCLVKEIQTLRLSMQKELEEEYFRARCAFMMQQQQLEEQREQREQQPDWKSTSICTTDKDHHSEFKVSLHPQHHEHEEVEPQVPISGIKLSFLLNEFIQLAGGVDKLKGMTTHTVCETIIKPNTRRMMMVTTKTKNDIKTKAKYATSSYCDMLVQQQQQQQQQQQEYPKDYDYKEQQAYGETANVFVSHARSYYFLDLLQALEWHLRDELDTAVLWIDIFSINQHHHENNDNHNNKNDGCSVGWWNSSTISNSFQSTIQQIGRTVLVMAPWDDPVPFSRTWCLLEVYYTTITNATFEIAMKGQSEHSIFLEEIKVNTDTIMTRILSTIQSETSRTDERAPAMILHNLIRTDIGFLELDGVVLETYIEWVTKVVEQEAMDRRMITGDDDDEEAQSLLRAVGLLNLVQGKYEEAETCFTECLERSTALMGDEDNPDVLTSLHHLGRALNCQGKYEEAKAVLTRCLEGRNCVLGKFHPDTLSSMDVLASVYSNMEGKGLEAQLMYEECLERQKSVLGEYDPQTLGTMNSLAIVYALRGMYAESQALYELCLERRRFVHGEAHPDTLATMNNLAVVCSEQGKDLDARILYEDCWDRQRAVYGENHPDTLRTKKNLKALEARMRYS